MLWTMATSDRSFDRAQRRARRLLISFANEVRDARIMAGLSQAAVAAAARMSAPKISRVEAARLTSLSLVDATVIADVVGLDLAARAYPGRKPTRDSAHGKKLQGFLAEAGPPLRWRTEALVRPRKGVPEQRSWDALLALGSEETAVDLELRLYDVQAQMRRLLLKWRDSGVPRLLLLVADTRANRRVLRESPGYFTELPRLSTRRVLEQLRAGRLPPSGLILI